MKQETRKLELVFGALCDSISKQLRKQGFKFDKKEVEHFEQDAEAITRIRIRGLLTDSATDTATNKLYKKIERHIINQNKLKPNEKVKKNIPQAV